jgi:hypothetical protein
MSETAGNLPHSGNVVTFPRGRRAPPLVDLDEFPTIDGIGASTAHLVKALRQGEAMAFFAAVGNVFVYRELADREAHKRGGALSERWHALHEAALELEEAVFAAPAENVSALWGKAMLLAELRKHSHHPDEETILADIVRGLDRLARKWPDLALPVLDQ